MRRLLAALLAVTASSAPAAPPPPGGAPPAAASDRFPGAAELRRAGARYAPVDLRVDLGALPASERTALARLVRAARIIDGLFLRQVWAGNEALLLELAQDASPLGRARLAAFLRDKGPWDRLEGDRPFLPGVPAKPEAASFYPAGASREEVEAWLAKLAPPPRRDARGVITTNPPPPRGGVAGRPDAVE